MPSIDLDLTIACAVAAAVSFAVAGLVRRVALERGVVVAPRQDRWHRQPTPTYGGIGVVAGLFMGAAVAALGLAVAFPQELGPALVAVLIALAGELAGFLVWNRNPARMFMGNCGSLAVGGTIAAAVTIAIARAGTVTTAAAAALILVVPIFDSAFVVVLRRLAGRSTTRGNIDHTSHRLVSAGFADKTAVALLYAHGGAGALAGYLVHARSASGRPGAG